MSAVFWRRLERLENPAGHEMSTIVEILERGRRRQEGRLRNPDPEAEEEESRFRATEAREAAGDLSELERLMLAGRRRIRAAQTIERAA